MKTLVLAAGKPREELSVLVPPGQNKVLLRILGKPIIYYPLTAINKTLKSEILLVYRSGEEKVYQTAAKYIDTIMTPIPQYDGNSVTDALLIAAEKLGDTDYFLLVFGDIVFSEDAIAQVLSTHLTQDLEATILVTPLVPEYAYTYGVVRVDEEGYVKRVIENPQIVAEEPYYVTGGIYILPTYILDEIKRKNMSFPQALNHLAQNGKMKAVYWSGLWIDIGYPWDLLEAVHQLMSRMNKTIIARSAEIENNVVIEGPAIIDDGVYIDHYAVIKGPVYIGKNSFIGTHSFVRHFTDLEKKTRIGAFAEVKNTITQPYTLLDSKVILADSIIGENTIIGANSITLNILPEQEKYPRLRTHLVKPTSIKVHKRKLGAIIGYNVKINPATIISPGSIIKPNSVISHIKPLKP